jgi:hypothetical protein
MRDGGTRGERNMTGFSQEYVVLLQLCEKFYTYECIDTVLFCVAKVLIYANMPIESCDAEFKKYLN